MLLARPRFPMRFFSSVGPAAEWLCATTARGASGPLAPGEIVAAAEQVRRLDPARRDDNRPAGAFRAVSA